MYFVDEPGFSGFGCSARALQMLGKSKGYTLVCCTDVNCIFVRDDLFPRLGFPPPELHTIFKYCAVNNIVATYTGQGFIAGNLYCHGLNHKTEQGLAQQTAPFNRSLSGLERVIIAKIE